MIRDKSIKQPKYNRVQYTLSDDELIELKTACVKSDMNLKDFTRVAVLYYINILEQNTDGEE